MREPNTPRALQRAADEAWRILSDQDRDRSTRYAQADDRAASGDALPISGRARRAENWVAALYRYEAFWRTHAHAPRENTRDRKALPAGERRMGEWARYQRRLEDRLCLYQRIRLDLSPAFVWDPHEAAWQANWDACTRHFAVTGVLPRLNSNDQIEFALARWLARQLRHYQTGTLPKPRRALMATLLRLRAH